MNIPKLAIVIPCYNEERVLPKTAPIFRDKIRELVTAGKIDSASFVLFCNDGSSDHTWEIIKSLSASDHMFRGLSLSRNRGHQNVLLAGLMAVKDQIDVAISIDCDGQDDVNAMGEMVEKYKSGAEIVYGVRSKRTTDTWFKRFTAESFYKLMAFLGADVVFNHADYRLVSARVIKEFSNYGEVNLFLRGLFPLVGFKSDIVSYERHERVDGDSHYPFMRMLGFAWDGITSLSVKPIRLIFLLGLLMALMSLCMIIWCFVSYFLGHVVPGWASNVIVSCLIGGVQLISIGVIGEYVGKIYLEVKHRPRYIVSETVGKE